MKKNITLVTTIIIMSFALYSATESDIPEAKKETTPVVTSQEAIQLINSLIKGNTGFIGKLSHPLLPSKVRLWQQRNLIKYPTQQIPWVTFKKDINEFNTFLHSLLQKDPQTGLYYHLERLQKNASLYKALQKIEKALTMYEPKIESTTPFKLEKESLDALQKLINIYGITLYQEKLLPIIKKFSTDFESEAKKIRSVEEKAAQQASQPKQQERFDIIDMDPISSDIDLGSELDFTEPLPGSDIDLDLFSSDISDDFISSFFE